MDALLTLSSKGQLVIPSRLRQLLGLQPGDRLALSLEACFGLSDATCGIEGAFGLLVPQLKQRQSLWSTHVADPESKAFIDDWGWADRDR